MPKLDRRGLIFLAAVILVTPLSCTTPSRIGTEGTGKEIEINTLVIPSRNHTRMQPEIYYAFMNSAKHRKPVIMFDFDLFNPFLYDSDENIGDVEKELLDLFHNCAHEVVQIKKANPKNDRLLDDIRVYIKKNPDSLLAEACRRIEEIMSGYQFLIIESSDTYGPHPIFYRPDVVSIETPDGAAIKDLIETLYDLFFVGAALAQNKTIWGTCHGSQIGFIHAGGSLGRLFEYKEGGYEDVEFKKSAPKYIEEEIWRIDTMLYTQEPGTNCRELS